MEIKTGHKITALQNTALVFRPRQSSVIRAVGLPGTFYNVPKGSSLTCLDLEWWEGSADLEATDGDDYWWFRLAESLPNSSGLDWFAFARHWAAAEEKHKDIEDEPVEISDSDKQTAAGLLKSSSKQAMEEAPSADRLDDLGPTIQVPGLERSRHLLEPIFWVDGKPCPFTWAELTANGTRIPNTEGVTRNIRRITELLTVFRTAFDQPIGITSGYRPSYPVDINYQVGGVHNSRHTDPYGDAADWYPMTDGITEEAWKLVCSIQKGGGLSVSGVDGRPDLGFFHSDCRGNGDPASDRRGRTFWGYPRVPSWAYGRGD